MAVDADFLAHLKSGATTVCRCWEVARRDGRRFGFTDHDADLAFDGLVFKARTGLAPGAVQQSTGLSVDNAEAMGVLSDAAVTEADILAGRFDGAEVTAWLVNWADPAQRHLQFRGSIGDIQQGKGAFQAELRGLSDVLNRVQGRSYLKRCGAVLGDARCGVDLASPLMAAERAAEEVAQGQVFRFADFTGFDAGWFTHGRMSVLSGAAAGLSGRIKSDRFMEGVRVIEVWESLRAEVVPGDLLRLEAGCDKSAESCRYKFSNFNNFRGFPHIPGEDWLLSYPVSGKNTSGGKLAQ
ncbi:hypothetical protein PSA7680_00822 [Pseudoruegeria aquimaris]|uniref:Bacteriophage phiJL001 Gp84 C-terminal domain-containing protein n=1 Tax=Pseudoruegeria aquimaris TaxID=393663 RepID=A0A1Y5RNI0_9RHOB|nr:DUF2163 domain-containing protein [Pseudoruegeria aquimaris]SLN21737.1 hypothetical protein PSA7680_00822 [Pseudoruegeria aquimaris]